MDYKESLIKNLKTKVFCRLQPSDIDGIGVFAIKKIPKGTDPFVFSFHFSESYIKLSEKDIADVDKGVLSMLYAYSLQEDGHYHIPAQGLNRICIENYLNSSSDYNLSFLDTNYSDYYRFVANRDIEVGEELTVDVEVYKVDG